ncbi:ABC transporter ATP-binding protein/permease [Lutimonas saemankumensis]|uniref:ABC transporter ATP-binding protein n=1 Tax=Lutimonas saemankumensis TaxID=483016 RepID=UPI001CD419CE|nr:ABC transporter ATP-binding protein [Lutimonas saemankumensis]MCA0930978.1 ABC transporter ATP-binding protein/permease [Lutimonas saemankumensis]
MEENKKVIGKVYDVKLFTRLMGYARSYRLQFAISVMAVLSVALFAAVRPVLLKTIIDDFIFSKNEEQLVVYIGLMVLVLCFEVIFQFLFIYFANWLGQSIIKDMRVQLFEHLLRFKMKYFNTSAVGKLVTRVVSDIETIASVFGQGLFMIISDLLKMLVVALVMLYMNWKLALIVFAILPLLIFATKIFQKAMKSAFQEVRTEVANLNSFVQERITGMRIIQLFSREKIEYEKFRSINEKHKRAWIRTVWYNSIFFPVAEILPSIAIGLVVWYGGLNAATNSSVTAGEIISFIMMNNMLFRPLRQIADKFNTLQMGMVAAERVFKIVDAEETELDKGEIMVENFKGKVSFDNVHFSYVPGEEVIKGISFDVKPGETVAIVGATGAGKSTIINLLNRFYEIDTGSIKIDDVKLSDYNLHALRAQIAVVLQDVFLFSDSIFNNITLRDDSISREAVEASAKIIGIHDFIMSLPGGYDYNVKERGVMLSVGQRQLIAFLRASVSKPGILILDEATSSIDAHSEKLIQDATEKITKNRTSIIIAHRLATIQKADKIIVMDQGKIVEQGTHTELLEKKGYYSNLYNIQFAQKKAS